MANQQNRKTARPLRKIPSKHPRPDDMAQLRPVCRDGEEQIEEPIQPKKGHENQMVSLPMKLLKERAQWSLDGWRPKGSEVFYQPRVASAEPQFRLKRFRGRKVIPTVSSYIYNGESRRILTDTSYPWRCAGRFWGAAGQGTAALVGRRLILTAAHAIPWGNLWGSPMTFVPAYDNGSSRFGSSFTSSVNGVARWEDNTSDVCGYDMAVCRLDRDLGDSLGYFGINGYDSDWEDLSVFAVIGYPWDIAGSLRPTVETQVAVVDDDNDSYDTSEIETKSDTASGMSGGPIFASWGGDMRIIGAASGYEEDGLDPTHTVFAGGNGLIRLVRWARDNWDG